VDDVLDSGTRRVVVDLSCVTPIDPGGAELVAHDHRPIIGDSSC
jgi:hypothetical protein